MNGVNSKSLKRKKMLLHDRGLCRRIFENLKDVGCCERCAMRYLGERDPKCYRSVADTLKKKIYNDGDEGMAADSQSTDEPREKIPKKNPCVSCLGLLDEGCLSDNIQKICAEVTSAGFDADSFTCAITLPICMLIRAHSLWLHLAANFGEVYQKLREEDHVVSIKEVWKWVVSAEIARGIGKTLDSGISSDFFVGINVLYEEDEKECLCLMEMQKETFLHRKQKKKKYNGELFTRKAVETALQQTLPSHFKSHFPSPPPVPSATVKYDKVSCTHTSLYIAGRYRKYSRSLSQTPWVVDGEKKMETSVQELICNRIIPIVKADSARFSASGREDVDVRTLGRGRPFVVEFINPHRVKFSAEDIAQLQDEINGSTGDIAIRDLQIVAREELVILKEGEEEKTKRYTALCVSLDGIPVASLGLERLSQSRNLVLQQKTPIRVLHRRPLAVRERSILEMWAEPVGEDGAKDMLFKLHLKTQAGTYIKEFVHGDFGRTKPNLCLMLGTDVDILALDVEEVELDWPKKLTND